MTKLLGSLVLAALSMQANDLFYTTAGVGAELVAINVHSDNTTTTTLIGPMNGGVCASLALSPWGTLYSVCGDLFGTQQLATIDRATGQSNLFGVAVPGLAVMAMEFGPGGNLYAVGNLLGSPYNSLYQVDVRTGAFTLIGPTGAPLFFMALTIDRDGEIYGVTCDLGTYTDLSTLYRIDRATGHATKIVDLGNTSIMGLSFNQEKDKLYVTDFNSANSNLYLVNIRTGSLTPVAAIGYGHSSNLVAVPETD